MAEERSDVKKEIEHVFQELGGFTWEQAENWACFCNSVGMEPLPYLKVMLNNICDVKTANRRAHVPEKADCAQLWVVFRAGRAHFMLVEPEEK